MIVRIRSKKKKRNLKENNGITNKPMNTCSFFIGCYTEVDHLISTKVFDYVWLRCNHIIDHV